MRAEARRVGSDRLAVPQGAGDPVADIEPVPQPQGKHLLLVGLVLLGGEEGAAVVSAHDPWTAQRGAEPRVSRGHGGTRHEIRAPL